MSSFLSDFSMKYRFITLLIICCAVFMAAKGLPRTKITSDFEIFFSKDNPELNAYHDLQETYTKIDSVMYVVTPNSGDVFTKEGMLAVEALTEAAWELPHSIRVESLSNYQHTEAEEDDLLVDSLIPDASIATPEDLAKAKLIATTEPTLLNRLIKTDTKTTGVFVTFSLPGVDKHKEVPEVVTAARALKAKIAAEHDVDMKLSGNIMGNTAFKEYSLLDLKTLVPTAFFFALVCIAIYMYVASGSVITLITGTFATVCIIITSILTAQGIGSWLDIELSPPVANAPTIILTLAIADSIHILVSFFQSMRKGATKLDAIRESLRLNHQPVLLTSITTLVGFMTLNFSDSPPFHDFGNIVAMGIAAAWLYSITLLPALMLILPVRVKPVKEDESDTAMSKLAEWVILRQRGLFVTFTALIAITFSFIPANNINDVWIEYFDKGTWIRDESDFMRENLTNTGTIQFSISSGMENGISNPEYLAKLEAFSNWLLDHHHVTHVLTFTDVMKRLNKNMHGDDKTYYTLPDDQELASQYLLLYELSLPFGLDLNNQININKSATRVVATVKSSDTTELLQLQQDAMNWLKENATESMFDRGASNDVMFAYIGQRNARSMLLGSTVALFVISVIIAISIRSFRYGIISLIPNLIPVAAAYGIWGMTVGQIGLSLSVVSSMTMGIVVDYTVHFLSKYLRAKREQGLSTENAIRYAFNTVGVALVVTTIILTVNFGILFFSSFAMNSDMGLLTAVTIIIALIIDFLFLPPLLLKLDRRKQKLLKKKVQKEALTTA